MPLMIKDGIEVIVAEGCEQTMLNRGFEFVKDEEPAIEETLIEQTTEENTHAES